jgi:Skp family chaperone for outer membrane proteins
VFDIDKVADETGMFQDVKKKLRVKRDALNNELENFAKKLKSELQKQGKKLKKDKDLKKKIATLERGTQVKFRQGQAEADAAFKAYSVELATAMRDRIKPVAREVAYGMGFDVILLKNDLVVFDHKDEVDLTQEILMAYQARHPDAVKKAEAEPKKEAKGNTGKKPANKK